MPNLIYLLIEFLDELVFGVTGSAWPLMRTDLHLNYVQISLAGPIALFIVLPRMSFRLQQGTG
jgi:hypothetical protein